MMRHEPPAIDALRKPMRGATANGKKVHAARTRRGLTQEQLASLAGVDVKTVRKAEQGKRLDARSLARLALALETNLQQLIRGAAPGDPVQLTRRSVVEKWQRAWDAQDLAALMACYHQEAVVHLPGGPNIPFGGTFRGKAEIARANQSAWATCRTVPLDLAEISFVVGDDTVLMQGAKGVYLPRGDVVRLWSMQTFRFGGLLIVEQRVEYDTLKFAQLLGLPPADPAGG